METDQIEEMDVEVLSSMWPEDVGTEADKQFNVEKPAGDLDTLKEVTIEEKLTIADLTRLPELLNSTPQGSSQLTNLMKQWEYMQHNAVRLLREELKNLNRQREEAEAKELKIIEEYKFESNEPENVSVLDETSDWFRGFRQKKRDVLVDSKKIEIYEEFDSKKVDDEENSDTVATSTDMNEAVNVEKSKEAEQEEAEVKEEESERRSNRNKRPS
ncbi:histidine kinase 5 isoform X2 [Arabidopsis lyrata subsp. lyrata]|uniref:histidine kinase 5 isoform X2 n=1 Tax=Arabidopsis lyrata subsp. lyrata TaxID=81972 RepID=UPI000A29BF68|nr:histidine kinase 5 isoform X2 [Arabidopsis lyrata subsp. lyrata]|eukprot:XP_020876722.1 histidine kinase 5 isoform X2 [Arabidopsis lyrata subsp. lyrata]